MDCPKITVRKSREFLQQEITEPRTATCSSHRLRFYSTFLQPTLCFHFLCRWFWRESFECSKLCGKLSACVPFFFLLRTVITVEQPGDNNERLACLRRGVLEREATFCLNASERWVSVFGVHMRLFRKVFRQKWRLKCECKSRSKAVSHRRTNGSTRGT